MEINNHYVVEFEDAFKSNNLAHVIAKDQSEAFKKLKDTVAKQKLSLITSNIMTFKEYQARKAAHDEQMGGLGECLNSIAGALERR